MSLTPTKYSERPAAGPLDGTEIIAASQVVSGTLTSVKTTFSAIAAFFRTLVGVWYKNQAIAPVALTSGATVAVDASLSNNFKLVMAGDCKLSNPTNLTEGTVLNFAVDQDGTGGRVLTFDTIYKPESGAWPTWITTAGAKSFVSGYYDGTIIRCNAGTGYA